LLKLVFIVYNIIYKLFYYQEVTELRDEILERVAEDLFSIPPLIFRLVQRKIIKTTLADIDANITPHHFEIIRLLEEEGKLHVAEIGERLHIAKAQMTQLIDKLVELDLVERQTDRYDRRVINIIISSRGKKILREHKKKVMIAIRDTMSQLSDKELDDLSNSLKKLRDILSKLR
jgi:DNA-binding MarR family transcriptional regulator